MLMITVLLLVSCSEERKREAAKLEDQLKGDTVATASAASPDTTSQPATEAARDSSSPVNTEPQAAPKESTATASVNTDQEQVKTDSVKPAATTLSATETPADVNAIPDETKPAATPTVMPPQPHEGFTIQIGSSPSESYAQETVKLFTERGYQAYVASGTVEGKTYYRVRIGFFRASGEAKTVLQDLKDKYSVDGWIDQITR